MEKKDKKIEEKKSVELIYGQVVPRDDAHASLAAILVF